MKAEEYHNRIISEINKRDDLDYKFYPLIHKGGEFRFLKIKSKNIDQEDKVLMIRAGNDGNEIGGPITVLNNLQDIVDYAHARGVKIIIYPLANPSGFEMGTRENIDSNPGTRVYDDFIRYELWDGKMSDDIRNSDKFKKWYMATEINKKSVFTPENALMHKLVKKDLLYQIEAVIDLHQDIYLNKKFDTGTYQYAFGNLNKYNKIINEIKKLIPILGRMKIGSGQDGALKTDKNGFIIRYDGSIVDFFYRLGVKYSVAVETVGNTPMKLVEQVNSAWIFGIIDLLELRIKIEKQENIISSSKASVLPKKITALSRVHLIYTSSPVQQSDQKHLNIALQKIIKTFPHTKIYDVKRTDLDPRYLAASEKERLRKFRQARKKVDWLLPVFGGIGCSSMVRHLTDEDLTKIRKERPVVNGFSDTTYLTNYLFFKIRLMTFVYANAYGAFSLDNSKMFFDILRGKVKSLSYHERNYGWLTAKPAKNIEGIAIGGNLSSLRDLFDFGGIKVRSWKPYILFVEDTEIDIEDLHNFVISLDEKGLFRGIRALVTGRVEGTHFTKKSNLIYGFQKEMSAQLFSYLLQPIISKRDKQKDPLYILKINNFGHNVEKNNMIIPIGAKTIIHPDGRIEFLGPFVK